jgi:purine-binding chemotaxis protein CheW
MLSLTGMAGRAGSVKGVLNLRGRTIPVLDLRPIPQSPSTPIANRSCVVVLQTSGAASPHGALVGLVADAIEEVIDIPASQIAASAAVGSRLDAACLLGIANVHGVFRSLLDIDRAAALGRTIPSSRMSRRVPTFA